jgi:hypothetical protein
MRRSLIGLLLLSCAACAGGRIVVNLDIWSFVDPGDLDTSYAADVPAGLGYSPLLTVVSPTRVDLVEGLGTAATLEEGVLTVAGRIVNREGRARVRLRLHLGRDAAAAAASTTPVLEVEVEIEPDTVHEFEGATALDEAALDLFARKSVYVRIDGQARFPGTLGTVEHVEGDAELTDVRARLVGREDLIRP